MTTAVPTDSRTRRIMLSAFAGCLAVALVWMALATPAAHASVCAAQNNYIGSVNGDWNSEGNWSNKLPKTSETVCIPEGKGTITIAAGVKAEVKTLLAQSAVTVASTGSLTLSEKIVPSNAPEDEAKATRFTAGLTINSGGLVATEGNWILMSGPVVMDGLIHDLTSNPNEVTARLESGTLVGDGTFNIDFGNIAGTVEPGGPGVIGALHLDQISGQRSTGTTVIDIASETSFDKIDMESNIGWEGALVVNLLGGYEPPVGTEFLFQTGGGALAFFDTVTPGFRVEGEPNSLAIVVTPKPPTVVTEEATSVTTTTAVLNGTVNPNNESVTGCEFEYGTTTSYVSTTGCGGIAFHGNGVVPTDGVLSGLSPGTTYHFRISATNHAGTNKGLDRSFTTMPASKGGEEEPLKEEPSKGTSTEEKPSTGGGSTATTTPGTSTTNPTIGPSTLPGAIPTAVATTPKAVEELLLGCSSSPLVLNDAYIHAGRVLLIGSAAKSLAGKKVKILFNERKQVASATVGTNGQFATTAPLPPAKIREALSTRYTAEVGNVRSLHLKLTRRLLLEPPKASGTTVTLAGQVTLPLTKPVTPVIVEQQLECGKTTIVKTFTPPANGRFKITLTVPANAKAGIYRLTSKVAANAHAVKHGFTTFSLPLPVTLG